MVPALGVWFLLVSCWTPVPASSIAPTVERPAGMDGGGQSTINLGDAGAVRTPASPSGTDATMDSGPTLGGPAEMVGPGTWFSQPLPVVQRERYATAREIGRGGLGRVMAARDQRLGREVAIKELFEPYGDRQSRFLREALVTARLQHPAIVPVYDAGYWPNGAPFYAMKLVSGRNLAELIAGARTMADRLSYLASAIAVVDAIAYAHSQRILHRDLKPSNIIVGEYGETVVVDWGLAKPLDGPADELAAGPYRDAAAGLTVAGSVLGTPGYMAPEQARGDEVDERADVYALGAVLYHLLTGGPPYPTGPAQDVLHQVKRDDPPPVAERAPDAPPELVTIIEKAMARDPERRYQSARGLADDLRRFHNGQLVSVHRYSAWALAQRWLQRHRALVLVASIMLLALAGTAVWSVRRIVHERNRAEDSADRAREERASAQARAGELTVAQAAHQRDATAAVAWLGSLPATGKAWSRGHLVAMAARNRGIARHVWRDHGGDLTDLALSPDGRVLASASRDGSVVLRDLERGTVTRIDELPDWVTDIAFSPTRPHLATADRGHGVRIFGLSGQLVQRFDEHRAPVHRVAFSPDGSHLASADGSGAVVLRALAGGQSRALTGHTAAVQQLAFSPDGASLASIDQDGSVWLWSVAGAGQDRILAGQADQNGQSSAPLRAPTSGAKPGPTPKSTHDLAFSGDGAWLAAGGAGGVVRVFALPGARLHAQYEHGAEILALAFAPGGAPALATATSDGAVRRWDLASGAETRLGVHDEAAVAVAFSSDGALLASAGADGVVRVWNRASGAEVRHYAGARDHVRRLVFSPDGGRLWSMGRVSGVREWDLAEVTRQRMRGPSGNVNALAVAPDGRHAATGHGFGSVMLWDLETGQGVEVDNHGSNIATLAFSSDGRYLASGSQSGAVRLHDRQQGDQGGARVLGTHGESWVRWLDFSRDGRLLASGGDDGAASVWNLETGQMQRLVAGTASVRYLAFSPDASLLATAAVDGAVTLWDLASGAQRALGSHPGGARHVAFSPDGAWLASGGLDHQVRLWNVRTGESRARAGHRGDINELYFSPDGRYLASIAWGDPFVLLLDLQDDTSERLAIEGPLGLAWAPDGAHLAAVGEDATVWLWHAASGQGQMIDQLDGAADLVAFSPDGKRLLAGNRSSDLLVWRRDLPTEPADLLAWIGRATTAALDRNGRLATPAP
jgi:WD40 repeat protein